MDPSHDYDSTVSPLLAACSQQNNGREAEPEQDEPETSHTNDDSSGVPSTSYYIGLYDDNDGGWFGSL